MKLLKVNRKLPFETSRLETESIGKLLWIFSMPSIVGTIANALYNIIDRMYIGHGVGALALSGVAITFPIMLILSAIGMLVGQGAASQVSIAMGEKKVDKATYILGNALVLLFILSGSAIITMYVYLDEMLALFGASPEILPYARDYMEILVPGQILAALSFGFNHIMRASGFPTKAMYTLVIGAVINVILDPIFIFGFDWGIKGAAYSTVISMFVATVWVMSHFFSKSSPIRFRVWALKLNKDILISIFSIGLSPFFMHLASSLIAVLFNSSLYKYGGDLAVGAYGIFNSFTMLILLSIIGLNQGMQPIVGYNYGAKRYDRVLDTLKIVTIIATAVSTIGFLIAQFAPHIVAGLFGDHPKLMEITTNALRIGLMFQFLMGFNVVGVSFFQYIGKAKISLFLSVVRQIFFLIPFLIFFPRIWGIDGVWYAVSFAEILATIVIASIMFVEIRKIKKKIV